MGDEPDLEFIGGENAQPGQWRWEVWPMTFGKYRLAFTDGLEAGDFYCMENLELVVLAHHRMVVDGLPPETGWTRKFIDGQFIYPNHDFREGERCVRCGEAEPGECCPG